MNTLTNSDTGIKEGSTRTSTWTWDWSSIPYDKFFGYLSDYRLSVLVLCLLNFFIPLTNNDWAFIPYHMLPYRLLNYVLLLAGLCCTNLLLYLIFYVVFTHYVPEIKDLENAKVLYTLKNLSKSLVLLVLVVLTFPDIFRVIVYDKWNNSMMFFWGTVYVSTDLTGLLFVPGLSPDTRQHHMVVCVLGTLSAISNYEVRGLHQALLTLTYLSAVPYIVNTYLGLRHLNNKKLQEGLISTCFYVYAISILLNFWAQHMYVFYLISGGLTVVRLSYLRLYYVILKDDIHLMEYFRYKVQDPNVVAKTVHSKKDEVTHKDHKVPKADKDPKQELKKVEVEAEKVEKHEMLEMQEIEKDEPKPLEKPDSETSETSESSEKAQVGAVPVVPGKLERLSVEPARITKSRFNWEYFMKLISKGHVEEPADIKGKAENKSQ